LLFLFGGYQAIYRDPASGIYIGATEMRKDGQAAGYWPGLGRH
jgi:gamma-glutamyltranspeptidase/glutathione hydrolase